MGEQGYPDFGENKKKNTDKMKRTTSATNSHQVEHFLEDFFAAATYRK